MEFLALLPIVWLIVFLLAGTGSGSGSKSSSDGGKLPKGVERINVRQTVYSQGRIQVLYSWYLRDFDKYVAKIQSPYTNDEEWVEAKSKEELEQRIEETAGQISKNIRRKDRKR